MASIKAVVGVLPDFLRCVEVYHDLDHLDMLYRGVCIYCSL